MSRAFISLCPLSRRMVRLSSSPSSFLRILFCDKSSLMISRYCHVSSGSSVGSFVGSMEGFFGVWCLNIFVS